MSLGTVLLSSGCGTQNDTSHSDVFAPLPGQSGVVEVVSPQKTQLTDQNTSFYVTTNFVVQARDPFDQQFTNSVFRTYDGAIIRSVRKRWSELTQGAAHAQPSIVILEWRLYSDGNITDLRVVRSTADDSYNQMATKMINDFTPFPRWPQQMRDVCTNDYRDLHWELFVP
jgi:hypothetical protein